MDNGFRSKQDIEKGDKMDKVKNISVRRSNFVSVLIFIFIVLGMSPCLSQEYISTTKTILITDAIGEGSTKEIAKNNALYDAEQKALRRVTSTFRHIMSGVKEGEMADKKIIEEVHAKIVDTPDIKKVEYPFESPHVCTLEVFITVKFLDLDFFAEEIKKTAEGACIRSLFLSGWGQGYNRNYFGAIVNFGVTYSALGYGYYRQDQIAGARREYLAARDPKTADRAYRKMQGHSNVSKSMYALGFLAWAYSVWDAFEDRTRANEVTDRVHKKYFKMFPYTRVESFMQELMYSTKPKW